MKHTNRLRLLFILAFAIIAYSCQNEFTDISESVQEPTNDESKIADEDFAVLNPKKGIPFTIENMRKAYEAILNNRTASQYPDDAELIKGKSDRFSVREGRYPINTTHYYVKFDPQDSIQYEQIVNDTILAVSDIPFEDVTDIEGAIYQDPELKGTDFTYYYAVVPVDYDLPKGVPFQKIADLHFTEEDKIPDGAPERELQKVDFYHDLNTVALKLTDNLEDEQEELQYLFVNQKGVEERLTWSDVQSRGLKAQELTINFNEDDYEGAAKFFRRRKWTPSGPVTVWEDAINQSVGVHKIRVRVRKWGFLVIRRARTNADGFFHTSRTRTKRVKYAAYFNHRPDFTVKAGTWFWNARDRGHRTHKRRPWRRHYTYGRRQLYAFVHNAAYDYYSRVIYTYGLRHPGHHMKISAKYNRCASSQHRPAVLALLPISRIRISRRGDNCQPRGSDGLYATTVHELAHANHRRMDPGMFSIFYSGSKTRDLLTESWAEGVETIVTNDRYDALTPNYQASIGGGRWNSWRQMRAANQMNQYTPIVEDLIDDFNQNEMVAAWPEDRVNGYNLMQIQQALDGCRSIDCWEKKLQEFYFNPTEGNLTELFDYVREVRNNSDNW